MKKGLNCLEYFTDYFYHTQLKKLLDYLAELQLIGYIYDDERVS